LLSEYLIQSLVIRILQHIVFKTFAFEVRGDEFQVSDALFVGGEENALKRVVHGLGDYYLVVI
jgi:hypothetical protein